MNKTGKYYGSNPPKTEKELSLREMSLGYNCTKMFISVKFKTGFINTFNSGENMKSTFYFHMFLLVLAFTLSLPADNIAAEPAVSLNEAQLSILKKQLLANKGLVDDNVLGLYVDLMCKNTKEKLKLPESFWSWLEANKEIKQGLFSARYPMDKASILRLAEFQAGIEKPMVEKYKHLLLGAALNSETDTIPEFPQPDEKIKQDIDAVTAYMQKNNKTMVDIASDIPGLAKAVKLNTEEKMISKVLLDQIALKTGIFKESKYASRLDSLKFLIKNQETKFSITPSPEHAKKAATPKFQPDYSWPMFPIEKPAWVLFIDLGQKFDFKVTKEIWGRFLKGEGIIRYKGYGSTWKNPEILYRKNDWHPQSICRIIEDGGVCGRQATLARRTDQMFGIPSTRMPQPGHAAVATYGYDINSGSFYSFRRQSLKHLKETGVKWSFGNMDKSLGRGNGGDIVGIEHHMGLALAVNRSLDGYVKSRTAYHLTKAIKDLNSGERVQILEQALNNNPYNTEVVYNLALAYDADLPRLNGLIGKLRQLNSAKADVHFEVVRSTDTDFEKIDAGDIDQNDKNASNSFQWSLLVSHNILMHAYSLKELDSKSAMDFLKKELAYQQSIKKSPYTADVDQLILNLRMQSDELEAVKTELSREILPMLEKMKSINKDKAKILFNRMNIPVKYMKDNKERADYFGIFRKAFTEEKILLKDKKKSTVSMNELYKMTVSSEIRYLRKSGKEFKKDADELDEIYKNYLSKVSK